MTDLPQVPEFPRAPTTRLTIDVIDQIATDLAQGLTQTAAAARVGVSKNLLSKWLSQGRDFLESEIQQDDPRALLALACDAAIASYQRWLIDQGNRSAGDRNLSPAWVKWRLATSSPKDFSISPGLQGPAQGMAGTAFETVSPDDAIAALTEKLTRFLAVNAEVEAVPGGVV
jgi:hypothetical protein